MPPAVARVEQIIDSGIDPGVVIAAMQELDRMLRDDPEEHSESRHGRTRVAFALPLGVLFEINAASRTVEIGDVWLIRRT